MRGNKAQGHTFKAVNRCSSVRGEGPAVAPALVRARLPARLRSEVAFVHLCGVAPVPASSGNTGRHRLNRHGNHEANWDLYMIVVWRHRTDERTRHCAAKRSAEGKIKVETIRCLNGTSPGRSTGC